MNLKKKMTRRFKYYCGLKKRLWDLKTIFGLIPHSKIILARDRFRKFITGTQILKNNV